MESMSCLNANTEFIRRSASRGSAMRCAAMRAMTSTLSVPEFAANVDPQSGAQGEFKTPDGKVKPQAARFRIFEYEKGNDGKFRPVGEVTTNNAQRPSSITWTAHLANRKANFYAFHGQAGAEDEPLFSSYGTPGKPTVRNEKKVKTNAERKKWLELDP